MGLRMGGAATVMGLAQMIMQLGLPVRLRVIVAAVENVRMLSGITVDSVGREIIVTAEPVRRDTDTGCWRVKIAGAEMPQRSLYDADVYLAATLPTAPAHPGPAAGIRADPPDACLAYSATTRARTRKTGRLTQLSDTLGSTDTRGTMPQRPL